MLRNAGFLLFIVFICIMPGVATAQLQTTVPTPGAPVTLQNAPQRDTSKKTNTEDWKDEKTRIYYRKMYSRKILFTDTSLHHFHRRAFTRPWWRNLGNSGAPAMSLFFLPENRLGPTLGYHVFDVYKFNPDSLNFYNTTRPYSAFSYQLGSKAEQLAELLHTQNITPAWNFALQYRKLTSPGYYRIQRNNHDFGNITTNYLSRNQQYRVNAAVAYNKLQHDENGGIVADSFLLSDAFDDRSTIPVRFEAAATNAARSSVSNMQREFSAVLLHSYTWGVRDTLYSEDSTQMTPKLTPRFGIAHRLQVHTEKYQFKDLTPDSLRYTELFQRNFGAEDSVFMEQKWFYVDNSVTLNGFIGSLQRQLQFSAGVGNRFDRFRTEWKSGDSREDVISNYLTGELKKEALNAGEWLYEANAKLFVTGEAAGNLALNAAIGKDLQKYGSITLGFQQRVNNAPYSYTIYKNAFTERFKDYGKESVTLLSATLNNEEWMAGAGVRNYIIANYIFLDQQQQFSQHSDAFNLTQLWARKAFMFGHWVLDNELAYQQKTGDAPLNIPAVVGRHQMSYETFVFGNALKIATGVDMRWHTSYKPAAYAPFFNRFYYQDGYTVNNAPELSAFFNFKVKNFRAYLMADQLQNLFSDNIITAPGYPQQDVMIRFGFNWVMIN